MSSEKFDTLLDKSVTEIENYSTNIVTQSTNLVGKKILITKITKIIIYFKNPNNKCAVG